MVRNHPIVGPVALDADTNVLTQLHSVFSADALMQNEGVLQMRPAFRSETVAAGLDGISAWIGRHVANDGSEEGWASANNAGTAVLARRTGTTWAAATFSNTANVSNLNDMHSATQNGKLFLCYDSDVNRLHVWDGTSVRRVGLERANNVTAVTAGGAGNTWNRWYRMRNVYRDGSVTVRRSEPSPTPVNVSITDDSGVTVTKGSASNDGETHWEIEVSVDASGEPSGVWYHLSTIAVGTATYSDTTPDASLASVGELSDPDGFYNLPPSAKYIISDGAVLLMAGAWESSATGSQTTPFQNRVWFTRPLGSTDCSDDESITTTTDLKYWIDIGDQGPITGLVGPINGDIYVFKARSIFKLVPTGDLNAPYQRLQISDTIGAVDQRLIAQGHYGGAACIYFASANHIWVLGAGVLTPISRPMEYYLTTRNGFTSFRCLLFDSEKELLMAWVSVDTGLYYAFVFDVHRKTWTYWTYESTVRRGTMLTDGSVQRLYVVGGLSSDSTSVQVFGRYVGQDSVGVTAYISKASYRFPLGLVQGRRLTLMAPTIWYRSPTGSGPTITLTVTYGSGISTSSEPVSDTSTVTASTTLTNVSPDYSLSSIQALRAVTLEGLGLGSIGMPEITVSLQMTAGTVGDTWRPPIVLGMSIPYTVQEGYAQ